jgi:hypothetical protein
MTILHTANARYWRAVGVSRPVCRSAGAPTVFNAPAGLRGPLALLISLIVIASGTTLGAQQPADASVESGRKALTSGVPDPPWYDASTDGLGRLHVKPPSKSRDEPRKERSDPSFDLPAASGMSGLLMLAWAALAVVVVGLAYLLVQAFLKSENRRAVAASQPQVEAVARVEELPVRVPRGTTDLLGEARRHRDAGNFAEAIIYLYSYQLLELDRHQFIRLTRGKTNRQYVRELAENDALRGLLEQTMVNFEHVFFGNRPLGGADFEACWLRLDEFHALTEQVPA